MGEREVGVNPPRHRTSAAAPRTCSISSAPKISLCDHAASTYRIGQGLFSGRSQALKEWTGTYKYNFGEGFDAFLEYRTDWSNQPYFQTHNPGELSQHQTTATIGLVWWYGGRQGSW